jgi:(p)ppGpp synthase/HD superfamily hydrolase
VRPRNDSYGARASELLPAQRRRRLLAAADKFEQSFLSFVRGLEQGNHFLSLRAIDFIRQPRFQPDAARKDGSADWTHPVKTAILLWERRDLIVPARLELDEVTCVGLLHDTPENHAEALLPNELEMTFGTVIAAAAHDLDKLHRQKPLKGFSA